VTWKLWR